MRKVRKRSYKKTDLYVGENFPSPKFFGSDVIVIVDKSIVRKVAGLAVWLKKFSKVYRVEAGETLKQLDAFPHHMEQILKLSDSLSLKRLKIVAVGGGSLGDFAGFVASILKRGVGLVHIPTTWLAALDSSHGGKTALNVAQTKNQIGTFYSAESVLLIRTVLMGQPKVRGVEAMGELVKMAFLSNKRWVSAFLRSDLIGNELLWKFLIDGVVEKYDVVERDPYEKRGDRRILNLGHTFGHIIESYYGLPHGRAVMVGLNFAIKFSMKKKLLTQKGYERVTMALEKFGNQEDLLLVKKSGKINKRDFTTLALRDKKRKGKGDVIFIFLRDLGSIRQTAISVDEFYSFAREEGGVK